jgi:hypothetical protein
MLRKCIFPECNTKVANANPDKVCYMHSQKAEMNNYVEEANGI